MKVQILRVVIISKRVSFKERPETLIIKGLSNSWSNKKPQHNTEKYSINF